MKSKIETTDNTSNKKTRYSPNLFQPLAKTQIRVIDLLSEVNEQKKQALLNLYDKKMSTVVTYMKYDKAIAENASNIDALRNDMHNLIDEAYRETNAEIMKNNPDDFILYFLKNLNEQIEQIKKNHSISREIIEVACMKLEILCDLSRKITLSVLNEKIFSLLMTSLLEPYEFKTIVKEVGHGAPYSGYANTKFTLPIFSRNGAMGFNTILFAEFNDYFPVGFSVNPFSVHAGSFYNSSWNTTQHDFGHAYITLLNLKTRAPETFEQYKQLYFKIIEQKKLNSPGYNDNAFKEDILMLFYLVHELGYTGKNARKSVIDMIRQTTLLPSDPEFEFNHIFQLMSDEEKTQVLVIGSIDFIYPLQELGFEIDVFPGQQWKSAASIRAALLTVLDRFSKRHPEIILQPQQEGYVVNNIIF